MFKRRRGLIYWEIKDGLCYSKHDQRAGNKEPAQITGTNTGGVCPICQCLRKDDRTMGDTENANQRRNRYAVQTDTGRYRMHRAVSHTGGKRTTAPYVRAGRRRLYDYRCVSPAQAGAYLQLYEGRYVTRIRENILSGFGRTVGCGKAFGERVGISG